MAYQFRSMPLLAAAAGLALSTAGMPAAAADITLTETGSTLLHPLFDIWASEYARTHPGIQITTGATGSEAGQKQALSGQVLIGASDAYMSDNQMRDSSFVDIPLAISAQAIGYNLPGLNASHLRLSGPVLAGIYTGTIREWDAPEIKAINPDASLPHQAIVPVHRTDGSGDSFIFTQFLSFSTPSWENGKGYGTSIAWPVVQGAVGVVGNAAMVQAIQSAPYSIGYVGISYSAEISTDKIGTAALQNADGAFVLPARDTIIAGAASLGVRTPTDERLSLIFAPGSQSYPLVNYEYGVVSTKQADPAVAAALRKFLLWSIEPSETKDALLQKVHFVPLPPHIWELSQAQIQMIR